MLASELIEEIRDCGSITPDTLDATLLRAADAEIRTRLLPMVRTVAEEYLVRSADIVTVNGRAALPVRATGAAVRLVQVLSGGMLYTLPRLDPALDPGPQAASGLPMGFYLDAGGIVLVPSSSQATLRVRYFARPGRLCLESDPLLCKTITAVTPGPVTTTVTTGAFALTRVDIVGGGPSHEHKAIYAALSGGGTILQTAELLGAISDPTTTGVFDFVTAPDRSPVVALPEELGSTLALRTAARVLSNLGYLQEAGTQAAQADEAQIAAFDLLRPRSSGNPKRLSGGLLSRMDGGGVWRGRNDW